MCDRPHHACFLSAVCLNYSTRSRGSSRGRQGSDLNIVILSTTPSGQPSGLICFRDLTGSRLSSCIDDDVDLVLSVSASGSLSARPAGLVKLLFRCSDGMFEV
jgi:hypothetical protein